MTETKKPRCPVCDSFSVKVLYRIPDPSPLALPLISIGLCTACRHQFLLDVPVETLKKFYAEDENTYTFHMDPIFSRMKLIDSKLTLLTIGRHKQTGKLVEIGCGPGLFLDIARQLGYDTTGIEPSHWQAGEAQKKLHRVFNTTLEQMEPVAVPFDILVGTEVIEHVLDLGTFMRQVNQITKSGSIVYFSTGSTSSLLAIVRGKKWRYYEALHTQYFYPGSMRTLLERYDWEVLEIGTGFRLGDLWSQIRGQLSGKELIRKSLARVQIGPFTRSGFHVIARKR